MCSAVQCSAVQCSAPPSVLSVQFRAVVAVKTWQSCGAAAAPLPSRKFRSSPTQQGAKCCHGDPGLGMDCASTLDMFIRDTRTVDNGAGMRVHVIKMKHETGNVPCSSRSGAQGQTEAGVVGGRAVERLTSQF
jgi:hypothetical protein